MEYIIECTTYDNFGHELLLESKNSTFLTLNDFKQEVEKRIKILMKLGLNIEPDQIADYNIEDSIERTAGIKPIAEYKYRFYIAKMAARTVNKKYFDTIIYHELCHVLQYNTLFNMQYLYFDNGKLKGVLENKNDLDAMLLADNGHSYLWKLYANKLNKTLYINPPIARELSNKDVSDILLEDIFDSGYEIDLTDILKSNL